MVLRTVALALAGCLVAASPATAVHNGTPADQSTTKWFVSYGQHCGGTIIAKRWILTAAHCVSGIDAPAAPFTVHINPGRPASGKPKFTVDRVVVHPGFRMDGRMLPNDVAIMHTTKRLPKHRLPLNTDAMLPVKGAPVAVYGFGRTDEDPARGLSKRLQTGEMFVQAGPKAKRCKSWGKKMYSKRKQVCANDPVLRIDACAGDSGGPLVGTVAGRRTLVGIVSTGAQCTGLPKKPGLFTRVSTYVDWIEQAKTAGQITVTSSDCTPIDNWCFIAPGASARVKLSNIGSSPGQWQIDSAARDVAFTSTSGTLAPGESTTVAVSTTSSKTACRVATISGTNLLPQRYQIRLNEDYDGC